MKLLQAKIEVISSRIILAWTPRWPLFQPTMTTILTDPKKRTASDKITKISIED